MPPATFAPTVVESGTTEAKPVRDVVKALRPSVVHIQTEAVQFDMFNRAVPVGGVGTGEVIDTNGFILTNHHVIEGAQRIIVTFSDGRTVEAIIVGSDSMTDLAVIRVQSGGLTAIPIGKSADLQVGDTVIAMGHALDLPGGPTVTAGLVSALDRSIDVTETVTLQNLIQTDAAINPGNSGGPLVNAVGHMIGINTARVSTGEGIGFAIAIDAAMPLVKELIEKGSVRRGYLGVSMANVTEAVALQLEAPVKEGVLLVRIEVGSPADKAGLRQYDILVMLAGKPVRRTVDLERILFDNRGGATVEMEYYRGSEKRMGTITLGARPA